VLVIAQFQTDLLHHSVDIIKHVQILKPQRSISLACQESISPQIMRMLFGLAVLSAIKFDDKAHAVLDEIQNIGSER